MSFETWFLHILGVNSCHAMGANLQAATRRRGNYRTQIVAVLPRVCTRQAGSQKRRTHKEAREWIVELLADLNSPIGPTTRPPKSTPSKAAQPCTWSSPSVVVAREQIPATTKAKSRPDNHERKHDQRQPAHGAKSSCCQKIKTPRIFESERLGTTDERGHGVWTALDRQLRRVPPKKLDTWLQQLV